LRDAEGGDTTDMALKEQFSEPWKTFFNGAELPIADNKKVNVFFTKECVSKHIRWNKYIFSPENTFFYEFKGKQDK
jgi:hypothetical protein